MGLFRKKEKKVNTVSYTGKVIFYHNNGVSTMVEEGTFESDKLEWIKDNIGTEAIWQSRNCAINLKYFYGVKFEFDEKKEADEQSIDLSDDNATDIDDSYQETPSLCRCPRCDGNNTSRYETYPLESHPSQYKFKCKDCGYRWTSIK